MNKDFKYLPKNERKKILLICDDLRVHSGVATVAKEIVLHTAQHFNWVQLAGAINHPEKGKKFNLSSSTDEETGLKDSSVEIYPIDRSEEHTSELQSRLHLVCRLLLEKKKKQENPIPRSVTASRPLTGRTTPADRW